MQEHVLSQYFNPGKRCVGVDWAGELQVLEEYMLKLLGIDCMCCNDCAVVACVKSRHLWRTGCGSPT